MNISKEQAERLVELSRVILENLNEFKSICRETMERQEYEQFKYRTLGHIEPVVSEDHEWVTTYSSIDSLEKVAESACCEAEEAEHEDDEDEGEDEEQP